MPAKRIWILVGLATALMTAAAFAQSSRYTSPPAKTAVTVAGHEISVDYFAPSMHGRKVMGGLVPYGEVWCTGANIATGFNTSADLQIGDLKLPKGTYSIWTLPTEKEWTLIINKQSGQFHLDYEPDRDFGRTKMNVRTLPSPVETLKIEVTSEGGNKGRLALRWENTEASVPFTVLQ